MIFNRQWVSHNQCAANGDWPLSLGYRVYLLSDHPLVREKHRMTPENFARLEVPSFGNAWHVVWDVPQVVGIVIPARDNCDMIRFIELVVHEVSHAVDGFLERSFVAQVDTELRAYMNDWMVGKILSMTALTTLPPLSEQE